MAIPCRALAPLLAVSLAAWSLPCIAQEPAPGHEPEASEVPGPGEDALEEARHHFQEGLELVEAGQWAEAELRFRAVLAVRSSSVAAYNLASALAHQDALLEAAELLRGVVRDESADVDTRAAAAQLLAETEARIGSIAVRLNGDVDGVDVVVDERTLAALRLQSVSVDPGAHVVTAQRHGKELAREEVRVGGIDPLKVEVVLDLPAPPAPKPVPALASSSTRPSTIDYAATGPRDDDAGGGGLSPWLWAGAGAVAVAVVVAVVVATAGGATEAPVAGDTDPPVFHGVVAQ